jgi:hypothetical protein
VCCAAAFEGDCSYERCASTQKERHGNGFEELAWWWLVVMMHSSSGGGGSIVMVVVLVVGAWEGWLSVSCHTE